MSLGLNYAQTNFVIFEIFQESSSLESVYSGHSLVMDMVWAQEAPPSCCKLTHAFSIRSLVPSFIFEQR